MTESGKEMVNGVVKNYKTVTKYVTDHGKTTAQTQKTYEEIAATVAGTRSPRPLIPSWTASGTSTQTVTETLTDETTTQQKQIITKTCTDIVNGTAGDRRAGGAPLPQTGPRTTRPRPSRKPAANTFCRPC